MTQRVQDRLTAAVLLVGCVGGFALIRDLPDDAAMFVRLVLLAIAVLSVVLILEGFLRLPDRLGVAESSGDQPVAKAHFRPVLAALALIVAYLLLISRVGYFTSTFLFVLVFAYGFSRQRPATLALVSLGFTAGLYLIFDVLFRVPMPRELLGF